MQLTHVIAAMAASELAKTTAVSQQMRLTASNARAVAARAGEQGKSFKAITPFVDELADTIVNMVDEVVSWAHEFSQLASRHQQRQQAKQSFHQALERLTGTPDEMLLAALLAQQRQAQVLAHRQAVILAKMTDVLETLHRQLRSGNVIATLSFVEAASMPLSQRDDLNSVGSMIVESVQQIRQHAEASLALLRTLERPV